jgi:hypothetical protein
VRRIILRSGIITLRHLPAAAGPGGRERSFVTSDGMSGTAPSGDEGGRVAVVLGYGRGTAGSGMVSSLSQLRSGRRITSGRRRVGEKPERRDGR